MGTGSTPPQPGARGRAGSLPAGPAATTATILRSLVLAIAMFAVAALAGTLLSGAAPANRGDPPAAEPETAPRERPGATANAESAGGPGEDIAMFGRSMVVSGAAGLAVSVAGLVIVGRRRQLW